MLMEATDDSGNDGDASGSVGDVPVVVALAPDVEYQEEEVERLAVVVAAAEAVDE